MERQVDFQRAGKRMYGMLHLPEGMPQGGVVFLHGFGGHRGEAGRLFVRAARCLEKKGIACLRFDFTGSGDSEGEDRDMTVLTEVEDALAACDFFQRETGLSNTNLGLLGLSLGGAVAALLTARMEVDSVLLWAPVVEPLGIYANRYGVSPEELIRLPNQEHGAREVSAEFFAELPHIKPLEALSHFKGAIRIIHGRLDPVIPVRSSEKLLEVVRRTARQADLLIIEKTGHVFASLEASRKLMDYTVSWFEQQLGS